MWYRTQEMQLTVYGSLENGMTDQIKVNITSP